MWFKSNHEKEAEAPAVTANLSLLAVRIARSARWVFLVLTIVCVLIRASIFDEDNINMVRFGNFNHFGLLVAGDSYSWIREHYNHIWLTTNSAEHLANIFIDKMNYPTHTRFGTMTVGSFLACQVFLVHKMNYPSREHRFLESVWSIFQQLICIIITAVAIVQLLLPCLSDASVKKSLPVEAECAITASLQVISACSVSFILFRALVPVDHPWHWSTLAHFLSLRVWRPIARLSYCSYLIHFRLMFEINFNAKYRNLLVLWGSDLMPQTGGEYIVFMQRLFVVTFLLSMVLSWCVHVLVEAPAGRWVDTWLSISTKNKNYKVHAD